MGKGSSLEVTVRIAPSVFVKAEAPDMEGVIQVAAPIQEIAAVYQKGCQKCKREIRENTAKPWQTGDNIRFNSRTEGKQNYVFSELVCNECGARLAFGKDTDGNLFPRRYEQDPDDAKQPLLKDGKKVPLNDSGWLRYNRETKESY